MAKLLDKAADKFGQVAGIFSNNQLPQEENDAEINTPDQEELVMMVDYDYQIFKSKRHPMEEVWRKEQRFDKGDHWTGLRPPDNGQYPERMEYAGNYAWSQCESILARLTGWVPTPEFEATEENDEPKAQLLNAFIPYELNQIKFKPKHIRAVRRMVVHGTLLYMVTYNKDVQGGRGSNRWNGQNDIIPLNYGSFFPDPAIKDFIYLQKGRAHIVNHLMTIQAVREEWPEQGAKVMPDNTSSDTEIFDIDDVTSVGTVYSQENNQTTTNVLAYWYKGEPKYMSDEDIKLFKELADENLAEGKDPAINLAKSKGEMKGIHCLYVTTSRVFLEHKSYVYDHGNYPIIARTLFPEENNPWGKGYMRDLIAPQTMYNRFCELAIEVTSKMGNSVILYGTAAGITEAFKQIWKRFRSVAGAMLPIQGDVNQVKELQGVPPNPGILQYISHFLEMMQKIPGMFDSANGAANPQVTSGRQSEALINAAQGRLSLAAELIEDAVQEAIEQYVELCAQLYTTERVARITGKQVSFSRDAMLNQSQTEYESGNQVPGDDGQMLDERMPVIEEYVPKFDIKVNIGVEKPKDREYYIQTALTLFKTLDPMTQMPVIDAQAVKYTVENGRMEPMSVIEERMGVEQQQMQKMQELEKENAILNEQVTKLAEHVQTAQADNGQATADMLNHLQTGDQQNRDHQLKEQDMAHRQEMDKQKLMIEAAKVHQMGQRQTVGTSK